MFHLAHWYISPQIVLHFLTSTCDYPPTKALNCKVQIFIVVIGRQNVVERFHLTDHICICLAVMSFSPYRCPPARPSLLTVLWCFLSMSKF